MSKIETLADLEALYGLPPENSIKKETSFLTAEYKRWLECAPFFAIASAGADNLDCSPRGDKEGHAFKILSDRKMAIPDRRGNNRIDTLKNIVSDPRVSLLFLIPGINECLRVKGKAHLTTDPELLDGFEMQGNKPVTAIILDIEAVYFQCARALKRSQLWDVSAQAKKDDVPTAGQMTKAAVPEFDSDKYDAALDDRQNATLY